MLKRYRTEILLAATAGTAAMMLGAGVAALKTTGFMALLPGSEWGSAPGSEGSAAADEATGESAVLPLATLPHRDRATQLEAIAKAPKSLDQSRARYLLAVDLIQQGRAGSAIPLLENLEDDYPVLAAQILAKRAQAYSASGNAVEAEATWMTLRDQYPDDPATAEALFMLGRQQPQFWDEAIDKFPAHPRTMEIARERLKQNPNQPQLLMMMVRHGLYLPEIDTVLTRLTTEFEGQLTPDDWAAIGFAHWEKQQYGSAGAAYAKATRTPLNMFRAARGAQLGERTQDAIAHYRQLVQAFPDAPETATALIRLSRLTSRSPDALQYLDIVISKFPDRAGEALWERAQVLDALQSAQSASQARQSLLTQYSQSNAAAELRWTLAEQRAAAQDFRGAWDAARQIVTENPDSELAPEAAFWVGKWARQLGQSSDAQAAFEHVLATYPESYYAWRSAVYLGWDVGDFTTVRQKLPDVVKPTERPVLPVGSEALQELYRLGQDGDAWALWQVKFKNPVQPSVEEQYTDGLMRLGIGDNLDGIFMVSNVAFRDQPDDKAAYQSLKQQISYWHALYPFPFLAEIEQWSQQRQLNPLLVTALIRQESRFEPKIQSVVGATGLMQVMPSTADWIAQQIDLVDYDLNNIGDNIKLGTWYLNYTHQEYDNNSLFAVASYNAGPGSVADWIARFGFSDPDLFVEQIPFPETKGYVESVFENYWNYLRLYNPTVSQQLAQVSERHAVLKE